MLPLQTLRVWSLPLGRTATHNLQGFGKVASGWVVASQLLNFLNGQNFQENSHSCNLVICSFLWMETTLVHLSTDLFLVHNQELLNFIQFLEFCWTLNKIYLYYLLFLKLKMHKLRLWNIIIGARHDVKFIKQNQEFFKDNANFQTYLKM